MSAQKYVTKPVVIDAEQFDPNDKEQHERLCIFESARGAFLCQGGPTVDGPEMYVPITEGQWILLYPRTWCTSGRCLVVPQELLLANHIKLEDAISAVAPAGAPVLRNQAGEVIDPHDEVAGDPPAVEYLGDDPLESNPD